MWSPDDFIFPTHAVASAGPLPKGANRLTVQAASGDILQGVHIPPSESPGKPRSLILGFGGNAWNGQDVAEYLHELFADDDVVAFHYRGYRPSKGSPSAEALIADAPLIYDSVIKHLKPKRIIVVGFSIGSGVAAQLAAVKPVAGLILVTPFDSLKSVAQGMFPWLPVGLFFDHEIDAGAAMSTTRVPTAIVAAQRDEIVPPDRTDALRRRVPNLVFDRTIARSGHNDIYARSDFHDAMRDAAAALAS